MLDVGNILKQFQAELRRTLEAVLQSCATGSPWRGLLLKQDITEEEAQGGSGGNPYKEPEETKTCFDFTMHFCGFELSNNTQREVA